MFEKILNALKALDHKNDDHWTTDGQPRLDVLKAATGDQSVTREAVVAAAPAFNRTAAAAAGVAGPAPAAPAPTVAAPTASTAPPAPPAPVVAAPPVAAPAKGDPEAIVKATEALIDAQDALSEMDKWIASAQEERKARQAKADAAQIALDAVQIVQSNGDAIQAYLLQQRTNLGERAKQIAAATAFQKEHGFKLADLIPKRAKIDQVMARGSGYGNRRPPPVGGAK